MPDEKETGVSLEDTENVEESLFGDAVPGTTVASGGKEEAAADAIGQERWGSDAADKPTDEDESGPAKNETDQARQGTAVAQEQAGGDENGPSEDLKVVVSVRGGIATIGVQRPSSDPHVESVADRDLVGLVQEVPAVLERARARWEDAPRYPAFERPAALR